MSDIYTLVSNEEELKLLIEELKRTEINHFAISPNDNNGSNKSVKSNLTDILDFPELLEFCYYKSIMIVINRIKKDNTITEPQQYEALSLAQCLLFDFSIFNHLLISSLYTVKYLLSNHYMMLDEYVYYSTFLEDGQSFLDKEVLKAYTTKAEYKYFNNPSIKLKVYNIDTELLKGHEVFKCDFDYTDRINTLVAKINKSYFKHLFDIDKIKYKGGSAYAIRLFMPTYALLFTEITKEVIKKTEEKLRDQDSQAIQHKQENENASNDQNTKTSSKRKNTWAARFHMKKRTGIEIAEIPSSNESQRDNSVNQENNNSEGTIDTSDQIEITYENIKKTLRALEDDYIFMVDRMKEDPFYDDPVNRLLYLYKLNRTYSCDYLSTIFLPTSSDKFSSDIILALNKVPDFEYRCSLYRAKNYCDENNPAIAIDHIFPLVEKTFLALLASKFSLEELDRHLHSYLRNPVPIKDENNSEQIVTYAELLIDHYLHTYSRNIGKKESNIPNDSATLESNQELSHSGLPELFERFVENFKYKEDDDEYIYKLYDYLMNNNRPLPSLQLPFTIYSKSDILALIIKYLDINYDQFKPIISSLNIVNRDQLIIASAHTINKLLGIE